MEAIKNLYRVTSKAQRGMHHVTVERSRETLPGITAWDIVGKGFCASRADALQGAMHNARCTVASLPRQ